MLLIVAPPKCSTVKATISESGIERNTAAVARMLPRKIRIMSAVSNKPMPPSRITVEMACFTNIDWSKTTCVFNCGGMSRKLGQHRLDPVHHRDRVGVAALLQDRHVDRFLPVHPHDVVLQRTRRPPPCPRPT